MATYPAAVLWDLRTQEYQLDPVTGAHAEAHPVDAAVTIRLGVRRGTLAGDPTTGHTLHLVDVAQTDEQLRRDIEGRQVASLGSFVTDGLVELLSVQHEFTAAGRLSVLTHYRNTQTGLPGTVQSQ